MQKVMILKLKVLYLKWKRRQNSNFWRYIFIYHIHSFTQSEWGYKNNKKFVFGAQLTLYRILKDLYLEKKVSLWEVKEYTRIERNSHNHDFNDILWFKSKRNTHIVLKNLNVKNVSFSFFKFVIKRVVFELKTKKRR